MICVWIGRRFALIATLALAACCGCGSNKPTAIGPKDVAAGNGPSDTGTYLPEAAEVLRRLLKTYREAKSYSDQGTVVLKFRHSGTLEEKAFPAAVKFERPGRLFVQAYQATIACDGKEWRGRIEDEDSSNVDGQFLVRPAP